MLTGRAGIPVERTLLASGVIDLMMRSRRQANGVIDTPDLGISYRPTRSSFCRGQGS